MEKEVTSQQAKLMRFFMAEAVDIINAQFGPTYAIKNPKLVADIAQIMFDAYLQMGGGQ